MSKLFDDESDEEYQAQPTAEQQQPAEQQVDSYNYDAQPAVDQQQQEYNPYLGSEQTYQQEQY